MAKIEDLKASVTKAAERVEKCKATIAKHEAAAAKKLEALAKLGVTLENLQEKYNNSPRTAEGYALRSAVSEYESKRDDVQGAQKKLRDAEAVLKGWQAKLDIEVEKERFVSNNAPAVIIEFLNQWKEMARDWHIQGHKRYVELAQTIKDLKADADAAFAAAHPGARTWGKEHDSFMKGQKDLNKARAQLAILGGVVASMATYRDEQERLAYLEGVLEEDRKVKMFNLIHQVNEIVGTITDASLLQVNEKGNLDGVITGEKGKAHVSTIGVGGYNIVCFHYRTNVYEIKEKPLKLTGPALTPKLNEIAYQVEQEIEQEASGQAAFAMDIAPTGRLQGKLGQQMYMDI